MAAENFAEVVGIGEAGFLRDGFELMAAVEQAAGGFFQLDLAHPLRGRQAGRGFETVAEMAAAHAVHRREFGDVYRMAEACKEGSHNGSWRPALNGGAFKFHAARLRGRRYCT